MSTPAPPKLPPLGFLAVEVDIHRPPGDPFNERTWPFSLIKELVPGSGESTIVSSSPYDEEFIDRVVAAACRLKERGAVGVITSCGFLANAQPRQSRLAARVPIPICTSALVQIPSIAALLPPDKLVGILTYDGSRLTESHLRAVGIDPSRVRIRGCPDDGHLRGVVARGEQYSHGKLQAELVAEAMALRAEMGAERVGALVLECTQMPPFAEAIQRAVGVPVYDVYTMGLWFYSGLARRLPVEWSG
ncbi:uncharacterized protein B0I36DRAFT_255474 [Microdochium trichocladiopsis]|uniref:Aspartate/glutamate racemase family protein n=1 Tax=Microdochium trichocladiopsis TaxID=1682393 RepID=A0A9P8XSH0_9PEZI|nr:uncharacterized protein B0I36DRAFT_255474 [Microdochium trichocladiopsis]KAH7014395.1 hypothetical protein B0I36DRAFT_255474 [Microdochium trichocladiopsis]